MFSRLVTATAARNFSVALILLSCLAISAHAQTTVAIPDTPPGKILRSYLQAFNSGDQTRLQRFHERYLPSEPVAMPARFRQQTGGYDLLKIADSEPLEIAFIVKDRARAVEHSGVITVSSDDPTKAVTFSLRGAGISPATPYRGIMMDATMRASVIDGVIAKLRTSYVFPEVAEKIASSLQERSKRREFDHVTGGGRFADALNAALRTDANDSSLRVDFSPITLPVLPTMPVLALSSLSAPRPVPLERMPEDVRQKTLASCASPTAEVLPGNIGLLKISRFSVPPSCVVVFDEIFKSLSNVGAVIVDLRGTWGDSMEMATYVASYFYFHPTLLGSMSDRRTNETKEFSTTTVPGRPLWREPIFILTSQRTALAAEELAYSLKSLKRATIVGEAPNSNGAVTMQKIDDRFNISMPYARAIDPITKAKREGTGVEPDVKVPADQALETAKKLAAERLAKK